MKRIAMLLLMPSILAAQTKPTSAISKGSKLVGGSASLTRLDRDEGAPSTTSIQVSPFLLFFTADRVAVGGSVSIGHSSTEGASVTNWSIGPEARYFFAQPGATTLPFVGLSYRYGKTSFSSGGTDSDATNTVLDGSGGITWLLTPHVGLTGELFLTRTTFKSDAGGGFTFDDTQLLYGVRFGISAFVF